MESAELIFVPTPARRHLISMVELAKLLINRNKSISVTILIIKFPYDIGVSSYLESLSNNHIPRFTILEIPPSDSESYKCHTPHTMLSTFIEGHVTNVKDKVITMTQPDDYPTRLAGFIVDIFCISMIDVAKELNIPAYVYLTSGAGFVSIVLHLQALTDFQKKDIDGFQLMLFCGRKFREIKGLIVNTFAELETYAVESLMADNKIPPVYAVGPNLNLTTGDEDCEEATDILRWLDEKPISSVVFLCSSFGSFIDDQVKEIALALENSGHPFLWSLRPVANESHLRKYTNLDDILPPGFLERTSGIGKIIGWAPQIAVLSHRAVGGFVSHCSWNSILESVWFGVPLATWPLYAEQQLNAFEMVNEWEMAVDICIDYEHHAFFEGEVKIIEFKIVESKMREVMKDGSDIRKKVIEIKGKSRDAMAENGSSYINLGRLIEDIIAS